MASTRRMLGVAAVLLTACEPGSHLIVPDFDTNPTITAGGPGAVYVASNDASGNAILVFDRSADGTLTPAGTVPTGGIGTSSGLGNQLAIAVTPDHRRLFVVNAGSDDITAFDLTSGTLQRIGAPVPSGGDQPISLTVRNDLLYVLNAGSGGGISGFRIAPDGSLAPIPGSSQPLSGPATGPAQIQFTPSGNVLVVTEKATSTITTYVVGGDGRARNSQTVASAGQTPFGFGFNARGDLVVSEATGTGSGTATASSYRVGNDGVLTLVSGVVETTQMAACWIAFSQDGSHAYTTNTGSGTVSELLIGAGASLTLKNPVAAVTGPGSLPQDADFTPGGRFLYVRNAGGSVSGFRVELDGDLTPVGEFGPIPTFASGIVAR